MGKAFYPTKYRSIMKRFPRGFTVIELLLVIAIILVILTLTVPALMTVRRKALILGCQSNMRQLNFIVRAYGLDWEDAIPPCFFASEGMLDPTHVWGEEDSFGLRALVESPEILKCPADNGYAGADYGIESGEVTCFACFGQSYAFNNSAYADKTSPYNIVSNPALFTNVEGKRVIMLTDFSSVWHGAKEGNDQEPKYYLNIMYFDGHVEGKGFASDQEAKEYRNDVSHLRWWEVPE